MRLILVRHGETQSNVDKLLDTAHPGAPLTARGHEQAEKLAEALAHEEIDALYASTLTRAQQTAAPLAKTRGLSTLIIDGIHEIAAGVEEMNSDWRNYIDMLWSWSEYNMDAKLEDGESLREFLDRFNTAITRIEEEGHERVAVISHGAALRVWAIYQDPEFTAEHALPLGNTDWIVMNGSNADGWKIEKWADHPVDPAS